MLSEAGGVTATLRCRKTWRLMRLSARLVLVGGPGQTACSAARTLAIEGGEHMEYVRMIAQLIIALGILNVWLLRFNKATAYRAGAAKSMKEEFTTYGLPLWFMWIIGGLKILFALSLLLSFWLPELIRPAAIGMALLMLGALGMHIKVGDALKKAAPASILLILSLVVALSGPKG
jgi:hypothetical protein